MIHCEINTRKSSEVISVIFLALIFFSCTVQLEQNDEIKRSHSLNKEIMCPVCPGESIDQSQNPLAIQMRNLISEKIELGWSDEKIKDFFVDRYGPRVLLAPPSQGFGLWAWIIPLIILVFSLTLFLYVLRRMFLSKDHLAVIDDDKEQSNYAKRVTKSLEAHVRSVNDMERKIGD